MAETFEKLMDNITNFDLKAYQADVREMIDEFKYVDDRFSAKRAAKFIIKECGLSEIRRE